MKSTWTKTTGADKRDKMCLLNKKWEEVTVEAADSGPPSPTHTSNVDPVYLHIIVIILIHRKL